MALIFCLAYLSCLVCAQNDTSTPEYSASMSGWQSNPGRRGTLDIIVSCATTVFSCTWSIQHLNVPGPKDGFITKLLRSAKWMAITILLPEFILAHAVFEFVMARQARGLINAKLPPTSLNMTESFWKSSISRILPRCGKSGKRRPDIEQAEKTTNDEQKVKSREWTLTHCYFANMGGLYYRDARNAENDGVRFPLTAFQCAEQLNELNLPELTEDFINDKGKQDAFAKIVAIVQILYLVLSIIARVHRKLPYSQLEAITLAFAVCGVATYCAYWKKPRNVDIAIEVKSKPMPGGAASSLTPTFKFRPNQENFWSILTNHKARKEEGVVERIPNDNIPTEPSNSTHTAIPALAIMSAGFGCIHLIAWNFYFPTELEKILWKTAIVLSITVPVLGLAAIPLSQISVRAGDPRGFIKDCNRVLQEMTWHYFDHKQIRDAQDALEKACYSQESEAGRKVPFNMIIPSKSSESSNDCFRTQLINFVNKDEPFTDRRSLQVSQSFYTNFKRLIDHMEGRGTKKLMDNAKTFVFPRKSLLPNSLNLAILYTTGLIYTISRLAILALALSSLRSMPDEVYVTTWTTNIPSIH